MATVRDDLGHEMELPRPVRRVVSLVPSLTEAIAVDSRDLLVGATDWCTHPADLDVVRVRGTKNPRVAGIIELSPDVVIANVEENRELDVRRLREAGVAVWVTRIETVAQAFESMSRMFVEALGVDIPRWLVDAREVWDEPSADLGVRVVVPVWRDPWFILGSSTFAGDMLQRLGLTHVYADSPDRYPKVDIAAITSADVDLVLLPDEPYEFTPSDGPDAVPVRTALIPGRALTWYGPSLLTARDDLLSAIRAAL